MESANVSTSVSKAAILFGKNDLQLVPLAEADIPSSKNLGLHDALIEVKCVGICGSDVHYVQHGEIGPFKVTQPMILGHEASGRIAAVGSEVAHLKPGDRVAVEVGTPCRRCAQCREGTYNLCPDMRFAATPPYHGTLQPFVIYPADFCYRIPDNVSYDEAAMIEPLSVGLHAIKKAGIHAGSKVLITGAGPIGLVSLLACKATGATTIVVTDINNERLQLAASLGATLTVNTINSQLTQLLQAHDIGRVDAAIECSGVESAIASAIQNTKSGGVAVLVGMSSKTYVQIPLADAQTREIKLLGTFRYSNTYPMAIALIASGKIDVRPLITHRFAFEETLDAFEVARTGRDNKGKSAVKCMIHVANDQL